MTPNLTKLDYFAGLAMQGQIQYEGMEGCDCEHIVAMAYQIAAEMVKQSDKLQWESRQSEINKAIDENVSKYQHLASKPQEEIIRTKQYPTEIMDGVEYYIVPPSDAQIGDEWESELNKTLWITCENESEREGLTYLERKIRRKVKQ